MYEAGEVRYTSFCCDNMADPTLQTFCCHHTNKSDMALVIMQEFNRDAYNIVCIVSSVIGMLGAIYQVYLKQYRSRLALFVRFLT